jgi:hypothetical protein
MSPIDPETPISRKPAHARRVKDDLVIFDDAMGKYFATSSVGADIWALLDTPRSMTAICAELQARYEVDDATCQAEVQGFLTEMLEAGLIEAAPEATRPEA